MRRSGRPAPSRCRARSSTPRWSRLRVSATRPPRRPRSRPAGSRPSGRSRPAKLRHKDRDARWTVKFTKAKPDKGGAVPAFDLAIPVFGYQSHLGIDRRFGLIRTWKATNAAAYEGRVLREGLLDKTNTAGTVWADTAYRSKANERFMAENGFSLTRPSPEAAGQAGASQDRSRQRSQVEGPGPDRARVGRAEKPDGAVHPYSRSGPGANQDRAGQPRLQRQAPDRAGAEGRAGHRLRVRRRPRNRKRRHRRPAHRHPRLNHSRSEPKTGFVANDQESHDKRSISPRCPSGEHQMRKRTICMVAALFLASTPLAQAQGGTSTGSPQDTERLSPTERKIVTDARVAVIKIALQLTSEQEPKWPPVEEAIRARAEGRYRRLAALQERTSQSGEVDPVRIYRERSELPGATSGRTEKARRCMAAACSESQP